jgi:hypothetical protein
MVTEQCLASAANPDVPKGHRMLQLLRSLPIFDSAHPIALGQEGLLPPDLLSDLLGRYFIEPLGCDVSIILRCYETPNTAEPSSVQPLIMPKFIRAEDVSNSQLMADYLGGTLISPSEIYRQACSFSDEGCGGFLHLDR